MDITAQRQPSPQLDPTALLLVLTAVKKGDFSARLPVDWTGIDGKIADTLNAIIELNDKTARGLERVSNAVGKEGKLGERMSRASTDGAWARQTESVNALISDLGRPTTEMARVIGAVAKGDLTQRMVMEANDRSIQGEFMRTAKIVNTMVDQLGSFASEVTRVAREVGTEGKLGGQAQVEGVAGTWKDLTDNVNSMAGNLTDQVRGIARVVTAAQPMIDLLQEMSDRGVRIAIDDFGRGCSSLSYLKCFPIKLLKIDQAFVQDITHNADDAAIVSAIISMAHSLGLKTTAEGVETPEQFEFLRRQGCDFAQGHYFSAPQPPDEITRLMEANLLCRVDLTITSP